MTVATGDNALAADVIAVRALATSALTAAGVAVSNSASALTEADAAKAAADAATALAAIALSVPGLGVVTSVNGSDKVLIGQGSNTVAITVTNLHAALTTAIAAAAALGTAASGQAVTAATTSATALTNAADALAAAHAAAVAAGNAFSIPGLTVVGSVGSSDLVPVGQGGSTVAVSVATLLDAESIDALTASGAASDTDTLLTGQGTNVLTRQTLAALWAWVATHIPGYKVPVLEVTANLTIDATYNGRILVVTASGVTLSPNFGLMGSGFVCDIVTAGAGTVIWGPAVTATNGASGLSIGSHARLMAFTCAVGNVVLASVGDQSGGVAQVAPGIITGLTAGAVTSTSLAFSWTAPSTGGTASYFAVQYRITGAGSWTAGPNTASTSTTLTGLSSSASYDVQIAAGNSGGVSAWSGTVTSSTTAPSIAAPGTPTGLTVGTTTGTTAPLTWTAPGTGGTVATYTVQYRQTSLGGAWTQVTGIVGAAATVSGLTASTGYDFQVRAVNAGGTSSFTATVTGSTTAAGTVYTLSWGTTGPPPSTWGVAVTHPINCHVNPAPGATVGLNFYFSTSAVTNTMTATWTARGTDGFPVFGDCWGAWMTGPAAGTYYVWAVCQDGTGTLVSSAIVVS